MARPKGCPFHPRCQQFIEGKCDVQVPQMIDISETRSVNCFLYEEGQVSHDETTA
jgi:peptide/nickel transport system ATP-binding protein